MKNIFLVDIEYIPTRYSSQWKEWIPNEINKSGLLNCVVIDGPDNKDYKTTPGGFFNFFETNLYKMVQGQKIARLFMEDKVNDGDIFLFTDGWHPAVISLRQMINLSKKNVKMMGMFHAGAYDPADILGQTCRDNFLNVELGYLDCLDTAIFATKFSKQLMLDNLIIDNEKKSELDKKMVVTGFPYNFDHLYQNKDKTNNILFPHRISPEKHIELFRKQDKISDQYNTIEELLPDFEAIVTLEVTKDKDGFHKLLAESKYSISFADQETWGISVFESLMSGCLPIIPNKLSYMEMYSDELKYNPYDENGNEDIYNWPVKVKKVIDRLEKLTPEDKQKIIDKNIKYLKEYYCTFDYILDLLIIG